MAKSNIKLEATIFLMFGQKKLLEERIRELEERSKSLEEKTKQATEILENLVSEFDDMQDMIILGKNNAARMPVPVAPQQSQTWNDQRISAGPETITCLRPCRLDMTGAPEENMALQEGWWQSEGNFRWAGKDGKNPALYFEVAPDKEYELSAKIFVPRALAGKPVCVLVNDKQIADFVASEEMQLEKRITIPSNVTTGSMLKIVFMSDFWKPKDIDPGVKDERTLSLAFEYIELVSTHSSS